MPAPAKIPTSIKNYYDQLAAIRAQGASHEGATRLPFQELLGKWGQERKLTLLAEQSIEVGGKNRVRPDGVLVDQLSGLYRAYWEAKDTGDKLDIEIGKKIAKGYPLDNTLFEDTQTGVLYRAGHEYARFQLTDPGQLRQLLDEFTGYRPPRIQQYQKAVAEFRERIPELAVRLTDVIENARKGNRRFREALQSFLELCRTSLNPDTSEEQVLDMLKQHLLTERIFRSVFQNPDFVRRNAVAQELEKMVAALTSQSFSRDDFFAGLDYFYEAIEENARAVPYSEKQSLLNNLYEQFFQAYSVKTADTHGIVYTPGEIVRWMVSSVQAALQKEFGLGLESQDVHIIDPAVGTGTFIMELLRAIPTSRLPHKYRAELHANEVQLLPYYIAAQNIEHEYYERTGQYEAFPGLCFADTLDIMDSPQMQMFAPENVERVALQKAAPIRVVIGNPPYNMGQENENDNNKNRKHPTVDKRIAQTYVKASRAQLHTKLYDPYVKFFRWASDRLGERDGIICYVSNNSFLDQIAFDGMRQQLLKDFTAIYTLDLGGNVRKNPKLSGTKNNVFGIQVGVAITLLIRNLSNNYLRGGVGRVYYSRVDEYWTKTQKLKFLEETQSHEAIKWEELTPDSRNNWLTQGMHADFEGFIPLGTKETKDLTELTSRAIFKLYSAGIVTARDNWTYDFHAGELARKIQKFITNYNYEVFRFTQQKTSINNIEAFINNSSSFLKWTDRLKEALQKRQVLEIEETQIRPALYRPFCFRFLYFDHLLNQRRYQQHRIFPTFESGKENQVICASGIGNTKPFHCLVTSYIPDYHLTGDTQCFPFYVYNEDGSGRRENITDWALEQFRGQYGPEVSKWDIFHYVYAVLHAPQYRQRYAENLKRDLPRIPFVAAAAWPGYVEAGKRLAALHRDYEQAKPYPLSRQENPQRSLDWRLAGKMRLSPDRSALKYNEWLTLTGLPPRVFDYRLGNRSAVEWLIDQYQVSTDPRSGLTHDPNNPDDPEAIVRLVEQVVQVSLDTLAVIDGLPEL